MTTTRNLITSLALAAGLVLSVAVASPAGATSTPAPRAFTASFRTVTSSHTVTVPGYWTPDVIDGVDYGYWTPAYTYDVANPDLLLVKVYAADHKSGITYTCTNPVESTTFSANNTVETTTWGSTALCAADRGAPRPIAAKDVNDARGVDTLYVYDNGFAPKPLSTYRYKCAPVNATFTNAPSWFGSTYAAVKPCPVG